jgi:radical SAM superfamily enzyme YgiQ (UPF0313 family)
MKILLSNPPWYKGNCFGVRAGSRWPHFRKEGDCYKPFPFFLGYTAALLEKNNKEVVVIDAIAERIKNEEFISIVKKHKPDLLLMEVSTPSIYDDLSLATNIKQEISDIKIALSGPHFPMQNEKFLEENMFIDLVLYGEYEYTLLEVVEHLKKKEDFNNITGLIYRCDNKIIKNSARSLIENLDELPWPARHLFPIMEYSDDGYGLIDPILQMWASRGCPYGCIFCSWPQVMYGGQRYRTRNPKDVVEELKFFVDKYNFKSYFFDDDTFNIGKERIFELCNEIKKHKINLPWGIMARADRMDFELIDKLKDAGIASIKYGVESGSQEIVDRACKSLDLNKVKEIVNYTRKLDIFMHLSFTFGLPGETRETIKRTIDFALELDPNTLQFSIMTPFPGSKYFDMLDKEGNILTKDWSKYNGSSSCVMKIENLNSEEIEEMIKTAYELWQAHVVKRDFGKKHLYYFKKALKNPYEAIKVAKNLLFKKDLD